MIGIRVGIRTDSEVDGREAVAVLKETGEIDVPENLKVAANKEEGAEVDENYLLYDLCKDDDIFTHS